MSTRASNSSVASLLNRASQHLNSGKTPNDSLRSSIGNKQPQRFAATKFSWQDDDDDDDDVQAYLNGLSKQSGAADSKRSALKEYGLEDLSLSDSSNSDRKAKQKAAASSKFLKSKTSSSPARSVDTKQEETPVRKNFEVAKAPEATVAKTKVTDPKATLSNAEVFEVDLEQLSSARLSSADSPKRSSLRVREETTAPPKRAPEKRSVSFVRAGSSDESPALRGTGNTVNNYAEDVDVISSDSESVKQRPNDRDDRSADDRQRKSDKNQSQTDSIAEEIDNMLFVNPTFYESSEEGGGNSSVEDKRPFAFNLMSVDDLDRAAPSSSKRERERSESNERKPAEQTPRSVQTDSSRSARKSDRSKSDETITVDYSNTFEDEEPHKSKVKEKHEEVDKEKEKNRKSRDRDDTTITENTQTSRSNASSDSQSSRKDKRKSDGARNRDRRRHDTSSYSYSRSDDDRSRTTTDSRSYDRHRDRHRHSRHQHRHDESRVDMHQVQMTITRALTETLIGRLTSAVASSVNAVQYSDRQGHHSRTQTHETHSVLHTETRSNVVNLMEIPFFNEMLAQQVRLTQQMHNDQRRLYAEASLAIEPDHRYESLQDVKNYIDRNRDRFVHVRSFDEALQEVMNDG